MIRHYDDLFGSHSKIHGAANPRRSGIVECRPVGEIAVLRDLEGTEHAEIDMAATDHREGIGMMKIAAARQQRHRPLAGIDQVRVLFALGRGGPHAENAVLAMDHDFTVRRQVVRHQLRRADAEIDIGSLGDVLGDPPGDLRPCQLFHRLFHRHSRRYAISITRSTNTPGVTICSGSMSPSGTMRSTCATVILPAIAIEGPKLRADLL